MSASLCGGGRCSRRTGPRFQVTVMVTAAATSAGAVAPTNTGPIVKSGRGDAATKTWAVTSVGADARRAAARAKPPHARHMGVIVQSGRPMTHVGRAARRREDPPLLRGEGRFLD